MVERNSGQVFGSCAGVRDPSKRVAIGSDSSGLAERIANSGWQATHWSSGTACLSHQGPGVAGLSFATGDTLAASALSSSSAANSDANFGAVQALVWPQ